MRVGGPADLLLVAESIPEVLRAIELARRYGIAWWALGGGCNVLIADQGLRGLVIVNRADEISFKAQRVRADAGARLAVLAQQTVDRSLAGLEWAAGLPGTVGGGVVGNAGAFGGDIAQVLHSARIVEQRGDVVERANPWFEFRYRGSRVKQEIRCARELGRGQCVVLVATFELEQGDAETLRARANELLTLRRSKHPAAATMGSTFKNPMDNYAGRLIELAGLKGCRIGGAKISEQHANFLINEGNATATEVLSLIEHTQAEVERQFGVALELEIELLGW
jgi:UDP-N-acetylmuramate dehydrogenase